MASSFSNIILVVHIFIALALVGLVLLQRSEGGALGIGGGGGMMSARGAANALTRATTLLAAAFFATSIALTVLARVSAPRALDVDSLVEPAPVSREAPADLPALPGFGEASPPAPPAPQTEGATPGAAEGAAEQPAPAPEAAAPDAPAEAPAETAPATDGKAEGGEGEAGQAETPNP